MWAETTVVHALVEKSECHGGCGKQRCPMKHRHLVEWSNQERFIAFAEPPHIGEKRLFGAGREISTSEHFIGSQFTLCSP